MKRSYLFPVRVNPPICHSLERRTVLKNGWLFRLDPKEEGVKRKWYVKDEDDGWNPIKVPGCWQGQGFGDSSLDEIWDFALRARVFKTTYKGTGWYKRRFVVSSEKKGCRLWLFFGGVHPSADVWLNGKLLGRNNLPFVPFGFEITNYIRINEENVLVVRVHEENREFGFAYNWQGNWSGLYRNVELLTTEKAVLGVVRIIPDMDKETVLFDIRSFASSDVKSIIEIKIKFRKL